MNKNILILSLLFIISISGVFADYSNCTSITNATTNTTKTDCLTTPKTDFGIIIGVLGVIFAIMYFSFNLSEEHFLLRTVLTFFSVFLVGIVPFYLLSIIDNATTNVFYKIILWFIRVFVSYVVIYFIWFSLNKLSEVAKR